MSLRHRPAPVLFGCLFASQSTLLVLTPLLPQLAHDLGVSTATAGTLRATAGLAGGAAALTLATVGRRLGLRDLLVCGLALVCVGSVAGALAPTFAVLAAAQLATGAGYATVLSAAVAAASRWSTADDRPRVLSWALLGQPAAWIAGMPLIGVIAGCSWRLALLFPAAASTCALLALVVRERDAPERGGGGAAQLLRADRVVAAWAIGELLAFAAWTATLTFAGALLIESYALSAGVSGLLLGLAAIAYFPGNMLVRRRLSAGLAAHPLVPALGAVMAAGVLAFGIVRPGPVVSTLLFALLVLLAGARTLAASATGLAAAPGREVTVMGIRAAAMQLGTVAGAPLGGAALAVGGYPALGGTLALLFLAGAAPLVPLALDRRRPAMGMI